MQRYERELEVEEKGEDFKALLFANDRKFYKQLYGRDIERERDPDHLGDDEIEFPKTDAEFKSMVASMARTGALNSRGSQEEGSPGATE